MRCSVLSVAHSNTSSGSSSSASSKAMVVAVMALGLGWVLPGLGAAPGGRVGLGGAVVPGPRGFLVLGNGEFAGGLTGIAGH